VNAIIISFPAPVYQVIALLSRIILKNISFFVKLSTIPVGASAELLLTQFVVKNDKMWFFSL
jgi:hypothetical protein